MQLYVWGAGDLSRHWEAAQPGHTGHRGRDAAVEGSGGQAQPAPLAEAPHADAAGIDLGTAAQKVHSPHTVHVCAPVIIALPVSDVVDYAGAVLDLPLFQTLALASWVESQRGIAVLHQVN